MDYDAGVDIGCFEWSGNCVENFVGFDVGTDDDDVDIGVAVGVVVYVAGVVGGVGVVELGCCFGLEIYCLRLHFCRISCYLCFPSLCWGDEESGGAGIHHRVRNYILQ